MPTEMTPSERPECWVGRKDCGCPVAATLDADRADAFRREGLAVEPSTVEWVRSNLKRCRCNPRPVQESLL